MANYNDYQLEDAEDAAVKKSKNLKRGLATGAAVVGAAGVSAFGATKINESLHENEDSDLTSEDLLAGAKASADGTATAEETHVTEHHTVVNHNHVHFHQQTDDSQPTPPVNGGELQVDETALLYDEEGNLVGSYDQGKYNGKNFMVIDSDGNGKGDILAYDENNNGKFEENEISYLDNKTYDLGKGENLAIYQANSDGEYEQIDVQPNPLISHEGHNHSTAGTESDGLAGIHNDFEDEKTGEVYKHDLADNNPDYNNNGDTREYSAEYGHDGAVQDRPDIQIDEFHAERVSDENAFEAAVADSEGESYHYADNGVDNTSYNEVPDYGYSEPAHDDFASYDSGSSDSFDDSTVYDA